MRAGCRQGLRKLSTTTHISKHELNRAMTADDMHDIRTLSTTTHSSQHGQNRAMKAGCMHCIRVLSTSVNMSQTELSEPAACFVSECCPQQHTAVNMGQTAPQNQLHALHCIQMLSTTTLSQHGPSCTRQAKSRHLSVSASAKSPK